MGRIQPQPTVIRETKRIAVGVCAMVAVMLAVYFAMGRFSAGVAIGAALGGVYGVLNFFLLGLTVQKAAQESDELMARARIRSSYSMRMMGAVVIAILAFAVPFIEGLPCLIALLFPRATILVLQLTGQIKDE